MERLVSKDLTSKTKRASLAVICLVIAAGLLFASAQPANAVSFTKSRPKGAMATAVKQKASVTWEGVSGADGYAVYESVNGGDYRLVRKTTKKKFIRSGLKKGKEYAYYIVAYKKSGSKTRYSAKSRVAVTTAPKKGKSTLKNFLRTAKAPIGSTMYIYGGGWNLWQHAAGKPAKTTGLSPEWRKFKAKQDSKYNFARYLYRTKKGLDCTGFLGWCVYNTMNTQNGKGGYVCYSGKAGKMLANKGFGKWTKKSRVKSHKPGDVMSANGHVWIVVGDCSDGSTVLIHSSPPGVRLAGTPSRSGKKNSQAAKLARKYMKAYYPSWYRMFPNVYTRKNYRTYYGRMRWYSSVLEDPDGYRKMSARQVLIDLFGDPDAADTPEVPETPVDPVVPDIPDDPDAPDVPGTDDPDDPDTPQEPGDPQEPAGPGEPDAPGVPMETASLM